jgi:FO synthase
LSERQRVLATPLDQLLADARAIRDAQFGSRVTYSPKVFIPLTMLCRDKCGYCTFAQPPARLENPYLSAEQVLAIAKQGARMGCHEALFTLGERFRFNRALLARHGCIGIERNRTSSARKRRRVVQRRIGNVAQGVAIARNDD